MGRHGGRPLQALKIKRSWKKGASGILSVNHPMQKRSASKLLLGPQVLKSQIPLARRSVLLLVSIAVFGSEIPIGYIA